jgi:hypothetical protein
VVWIFREPCALCIHFVMVTMHEVSYTLILRERVADENFVRQKLAFKSLMGVNLGLSH